MRIEPGLELTQARAKEFKGNILQPDFTPSLPEDPRHRRPPRLDIGRHIEA